MAGMVVSALPAQGQEVPPTPVQPGVQVQIDDQLAKFPGGAQTGANEVSYRDGRVTLTIPADMAAADPCATGAYCFYDGKDFTGRKLTFRDCGKTGLWQFLTDYGFGNKTSSWQNRTKHTVVVYDQATQPPTTLWTENPGAESVNVGTAADNKADAFETICG
ncbi:peptidase inhibitor family I36 protein [Actinomadura roseirufa]|uniref:peptidase inhibitor family I36 protein n=1 Tax=Actinomadura roseirufa TaxID=2094049 RepID=UPI001F5F15AB|nr:peptidase inhibitor family I36 protein [Actinomadura roseirufa]